MKTVITTILIAAALAVNDSHAQTPDYEAACRLTPACMRLLEATGANLEPPPAAARTVETAPTDVEPVYTDTQIAAAVDVGWNDDLDRMMHSCTANIGGLWNRLSEALSTGEGQPLRAFRIHGQPPLSRVAQEADFARRAYTGKPSPNDVRDLVGDDVFTVWAEPEAVGDMRTAANLQATGIETIVVRPRGDNEGRQTVHPLSVETMDGTTTANLFGASIELFGAVATFNSDDIRRIVENTDLEALIITQTGEFKCNLDDTRLKRGFNPNEYR